MACSVPLAALAAPLGGTRTFLGAGNVLALLSSSRPAHPSHTALVWGKMGVKWGIISTFQDPILGAGQGWHSLHVSLPGHDCHPDPRVGQGHSTCQRQDPTC